MQQRGDLLLHGVPRPESGGVLLGRGQPHVWPLRRQRELRAGETFGEKYINVLLDIDRFWVPISPIHIKIDRNKIIYVKYLLFH